MPVQCSPSWIIGVHLQAKVRQEQMRSALPTSRASVLINETSRQPSPPHFQRIIQGSETPQFARHHWIYMWLWSPRLQIKQRVFERLRTNDDGHFVEFPSKIRKTASCWLCSPRSCLWSFIKQPPTGRPAFRPRPRQVDVALPPAQLDHSKSAIRTAPSMGVWAMSVPTCLRGGGGSTVAVRLCRIRWLSLRQLA